MNNFYAEGCEFNATQVRLHSITLRQGMNPELLPDRIESAFIGLQDVQHSEIIC